MEGLGRSGRPGKERKAWEGVEGLGRIGRPGKEWKAWEGLEGLGRRLAHAHTYCVRSTIQAYTICCTYFIHDCVMCVCMFMNTVVAVCGKLGGPLRANVYRF